MAIGKFACFHLGPPPISAKRTSAPIVIGGIDEPVVTDVVGGEVVLLDAVGTKLLTTNGGYRFKGVRVGFDATEVLLPVPPAEGRGNLTIPRIPSSTHF